MTIVSSARVFIAMLAALLIQAAQGALSGKNRMFSEDIQPLIERINWRYAANASRTDSHAD